MNNKAMLLFSMLLCLLNVEARNVYFKHLPTINGFSLQSAISIWQDRAGNMWFGNDILNKYDGNTIKTYRLSDYLDGVRDTNIRQICGDSEAMIYILADTEIVLYDARRDQFIKTGINADYIFTSDNGLLHYTYKNRLYTYDHKEQTSLKVFELGEPVSMIRGIVFSDTGIWVGTNKGLFVINGNKTRCVIGEINISCLFEDSKRNLWIGTVSDGVRLIRKGEYKELSDRKDYLLPDIADLSNSRVRCFSEDNKGNVWIGTFRGITVFSLETERAFSLTHNESAFYSLRHNSVYSIYKDRQGTMWIGSYYGGVSYFNPAIELYGFYGTSSIDERMLGGFIIGSMTEDNRGNLYIATEEGGINVFNPATGAIRRIDNSNSNLPDNTIKSIWYDRNYKRLYAGTFTEGLWYKDDENGVFKEIGNEILSAPNQKIISHILPYNDDYVLFSTQDNVYMVDRESLSLTPLLDSPDLDNNTIGIIRAMLLDSDKKLWISSSRKTILVLDLKTLRMHEFSQSDIDIDPDKASINRIKEGADGKIYLLSRSGIYVFDKRSDTFAQLSIGNSLHAGRCYDMAFLPSGRFIITTEKGISVADPVYANPAHLSFAEMFPLKSVNASCGLYVGSDNTIYIGGLGGLLVLSEENIEAMSNLKDDSHNLFFSSLSINNEPVDPNSAHRILVEDVSFSGSIRLNHKQNNISLAFASSDYIQGNSTFYEYFLDGFDQQWTISNDKTIRYTSLPPGSYSLIVREAKNKDKQIVMNIQITPPCYLSVYAYIIYTLLLTGLLGYIFCFTRKNALLKASLKMEHWEKTRLVELNQMKINFFTNVSHEFRTPLTLISSQVDISMDNIDMKPALKKSFLKIQKHVKHMRLLIDELMLFNKVEQGRLPLKVSKQDVTSFIDDIYKAFKEYAQSRHITFVNENANEPVFVWFDRNQMQKVFFNLLSNAFKFTEDHGHIAIIVNRKKSHVDITIKDTGMGIIREELDKIFEQFYQASRSTMDKRMEGMGIGLALSKKIVDQHSGNISVESKPGESTCFTVRLLLGDSHFTEEQKGEWTADETGYLLQKQLENMPGQVDEKVDETASGCDQKPTILIIEDNDDLLHLLAEAFSPIYNVLTAENGEIGLNKAREAFPDIILSDIMMPRLSGLEICRKLKSRPDTSHIPIVLITSHSSPKQHIKGLQYGADDYIIKPFNLDLLVLKCNNLVKTRRELLKKYQSQTFTPNVAETALTTNSIDQQFMKDAIAILDKNLTNTQFDINTWSKELKIGRSKLFQKIKEITGYTPNEYIVIIKMKKSAVLLKEKPDMTVAEIAYLAGFSSPGYFSKSFKEYYGMTPLQYRQS